MRLFYLPVICQDGIVREIYAIDSIDVCDATGSDTLRVEPLKGKNPQVFVINDVVQVEVACDIGVGKR
jgi:hypothetical protein